MHKSYKGMKIKAFEIRKDSLYKIINLTTYQEEGDVSRGLPHDGKIVDIVEHGKDRFLIFIESESFKPVTSVDEIPRITTQESYHGDLSNPEIWFVQSEE